MFISFSVFIALTIWISGFGADTVYAAGTGKHDFKYRLFRCGGNIAHTKNVPVIIKNIEMAGKIGYNAVFLVDGKMTNAWMRGKTYHDNLKTIAAAVRKNRMKLFAGIFFQGNYMQIDPNEAGTLPVKHAPFIVKNGVLTPEKDVDLVNTGFELWENNIPKGWTCDLPGKITFQDNQIKHSGKASVCFKDIFKESPTAPNYAQGRIWQTIKVKPFRQYILTMWVKTEKLDPSSRVSMAAIASTPKGMRSLTFNPLPRHEKPTTDWTKRRLTFNSLESTNITFYFGVWINKTGKLWIDDVELRPASFLNVVRRKQTPVVISSPDSKIVYCENQDFTSVRDPMMGNYRWKGRFTEDQSEPLIKLLPGSRLKEGEKVLVSYYHAKMIRGRVEPCFDSTKLFGWVDKEVKTLQELIAPDGYLVNIDEIRLYGYDPESVASGLDAGQMLGSIAKKCLGIIRKYTPQAEVFVWNDMYDRYHNAKKQYYYLVKDYASLYNACDGLPKDYIILNWSRRKDSMVFFAERGYKQVLNCSTFSEKYLPMQKKMFEDAEGLPRIIGFCYTSWNGNYQKELVEKVFKQAIEYGTADDIGNSWKH